MGDIMAEVGKQTEGAAAGPRRTARMGGSILLIVILLGALAAAFGLFVTRQSAAITRANDTRAFQRLAIAAQSFENWPSIAQQMAARNLYWKRESNKENFELPPVLLPHRTTLQQLQFGSIKLEYDFCKAESKKVDSPASVDLKLHTESNPDAATFVAVQQTPVTPPNLPPKSAPPETKEPANPTTVEIGPSGLVIKGPTITDERNSDNSLTAYAQRAREATRLGREQDKAICFVLGPIAFEKALPLPANYLSLLVIQPDDAAKKGDAAEKEKTDKAAADSDKSAIVRPGTVIAQIGPEKLPIRSLEELPDLDTALHRNAQAIVALAAQQAGGSTANLASARTLLDSGDADTLAPLETVIAGKTYRLYPYPVSLVVKAGEAPTKLMLVGVTLATNSLFSPEMSGARLLAFGLVLAALLALTPFMRLALLGPVDAVKPMELATLAMGLLLTGAITAALLVLGWDSVQTQRVQDQILQTQAETLATAIGSEIFTAPSKFNPKGTNWVEQLNKYNSKQNSTHIVQEFKLVGKIEGEIPRFDSIFFMDKMGRQPNMPTYGPVDHDRISGLYDLRDRPYFVRALTGDTVPDTASVAKAYADALGLCKANPPGLVVEHLLSRGDGVAKAIVAFRLNDPCAPTSDPATQKPTSDPTTPKPASDDTTPKVVGISMVMQDMLAPFVKPGIEYAVVDLSRPGWPSVFHSDPQRAHAELFELSLGAEAHDAFRRRAEMRPRPKCDELSEVKALAFSGAYIGREHRLATARVPCTDWAVVTLRAVSKSEAAASQPAEIAIFTWAGFAVLFGIPILFGLWVLNRWGYPVMQSLWPDPALEPAYLTFVKIGAGVGLLSLMIGFLVPASVKWLVVICPIVGLLLVARSYWLGRAIKGDRGSLSGALEWTFFRYLVVLVALVSIVPVILLAHDSRTYANALEEAVEGSAKKDAKKEEKNQKIRTYNTMFPSNPQLLEPYEKIGPCIDSKLYTPQYLSILERDIVWDECKVDHKK